MRLYPGDVVISALCAVVMPIYVVNAIHQWPIDRPGGTAILLNAWAAALIAIAFVPLIAIMRHAPIVAGITTLGLLVLWALADIAVLPYNTGYTPYLLLAPWAIYVIAAAQRRPGWLVAAVAAASAAGSLISPLMWKVVDVGEVAFRSDRNALTMLSLHWAMILAATFLGLWVRSERQTRRQKREQRQEAERHLIAAEVHDVLAHSLTLIRMQAGAARYAPETASAALEVIHRVSGESIKEVRDLIGILRDEDIEVATTMSLQEVIDRFRNLGMRISTHFDHLDHSPALNSRQHLALHRVLTEALTNATKHQDSPQVSVHLSLSKTSQATLEVESIGTIHAHRGGGVGLVGMLERCESLGGSFSFDLDREEGRALVVATIPQQAS